MKKDITKLLLNRKEKRMFELKAALYFNGSTDRLICEAVNRFTDSIPKETCYKCNSEMQVEGETREYEFEVADRIHTVKVKNIPMNSCPNCGRRVGDVRLYSKVEEVINEEVFHCLNSRLPLPEQIDFNDLLQGEENPGN